MEGKSPAAEFSCHSQMSSVLAKAPELLSYFLLVNFIQSVTTTWRQEGTLALLSKGPETIYVSGSSGRRAECKNQHGASAKFTCRIWYGIIS